MQQDNSSFWADIKVLEEQLAIEPDSFCFARLAEVYLKVGLVDDALHTARRGVSLHPVFLSGQRVLAAACHAKGLSDECLSALLRVTEAVPEDISSQKMLVHLLVETGNMEAARQSLKVACECAPDAPEYRLELDALLQLTTPSSFVSTDECDDEEILEDLEIYEELDIIEDDELAADSSLQPVYSETIITSVPQQDPLFTPTMAELYVTQGYINKALEIYRAILAADPANATVAARITELGLPNTGIAVPEQAIDDFAVEEPEYDNVANELPAAVQVVTPDTSPASEQSTGVAHKALATLEEWLHNIGRLKTCR